MSDNVYQQDYQISREDRQKLHKHNSFLLWFTGLSGSGKSTLANLIEIELHKLDIATYTLDGDNIRKGINKSLSFSEEDRKENIRRIAEISKLFVDAGVITLAAFVSPYIADRENIKQIVGEDNVIEVFINTSLEECEKRDVKGLYKKARLGEIKNMTGLTAPYEAPINPDIEVVTDNLNIKESVDKILTQILKKINLEK